MKIQPRRLLFIAAFLFSPLSLAESPSTSIPEPAAEDSTSNLTGKEILGITPNQHSEHGFTGYEFIKGRTAIINYSTAYAKSSGSGYNGIGITLMSTVGDDGRPRMKFMTSTTVHNSDSDIGRIGGYTVALTDTLSSENPYGTNGVDILVKPGYFRISGPHGLATEFLNIGDAYKARSTPAGISLEIADKVAGIFYNAFCPWSKDENYPNSECDISDSSGSQIYHFNSKNIYIKVAP